MLSTPRLVLRPLVPRDLAVLHDIWSSLALATASQRSRHVTVQESLLRLERLSARQEGGELSTFGIVPRDLGRLIGFVALCRIDASLRRSEVAYEILQDHWGRGFASEALGRFAQHAHSKLGLERLEGHVDPCNARSIRVLEKTGFRLERVLSGAFPFQGELRDTAIYARLAGDSRAGSLTPTATTRGLAPPKEERGREGCCQGRRRP